MHIARVQIANYKSFPDRRWPEIEGICFSPGFNVVVGKNNSGKTALVEALSLDFRDHPHRSERDHDTNDRLSLVRVSFALKEGELQDLVASMGEFLLPVQRTSIAEPELERLREGLLRAESVECTYSAESILSVVLSGLGEMYAAKKAVWVHFDSSDGVIRKARDEAMGGDIGDTTLGGKLADKLRRRVFFFSAQRPVSEESPIKTDLTLKPDGSDLAGALHWLYTTRLGRFQQLESYVQMLFPDVKNVDVRAVGDNNNVRVSLWPVERESERDDLLVPLSQSGTGVAQALAILYIVVAASEPRAIVIDEPQSFLHPGAVRMLLDILGQHPEHQYIMATHSPTVVAAAGIRTFHLIRKEDSESTIHTIASGEVQSLRAFLSEVGARLSDVFGADAILWVEGPTEEECFPRIVARLLKRPLSGTAIVGVIDTGGFERRRRRDAELITRIYQRLSQARALLPPAVGFIFDREGRSEEECNDLRNRCGTSLRFLGRRMYENYLLKPEAIAAITSGIEGFRDDTVTPNEIAAWIEDHRWKDEYFEGAIREAERTDVVWRQQVDGARLLIDLFRDLSACRVEYNKVAYGPALTEWLIENAPKDLQEVAALLAEVFPR